MNWWVFYRHLHYIVKGESNGNCAMYGQPKWHCCPTYFTNKLPWDHTLKTMQKCRRVKMNVEPAPVNEEGLIRRAPQEEVPLTSMCQVKRARPLSHRVPRGRSTWRFPGAVIIIHCQSEMLDEVGGVDTTLLPDVQQSLQWFPATIICFTKRQRETKWGFINWKGSKM